MAISIVQSGFADNSTSSGSSLGTTVTLGSPVTGSNLLIVMVGTYQNGMTPTAPASFPTLSLSGDAAAGFSSQLSTPTGTAIGSPLFDRIGSACFYAYASGGGTNVTVNALNLGGWGGGTSEISVGVWEVSGTDLTPVSGTAGGGGPDNGPLPAQYAVGTGKRIFATLAATDDFPDHFTAFDYESGKFSFTTKTVTPSTNDAIQYSSGGSGLIFGQCQVIVSEPFVPTLSSRPPGPFARLPASSFTR